MGIQAKLLETIFLLTITFIAGWIVHGWQMNAAYKESYKSLQNDVKNQNATLLKMNNSYLTKEHKYKEDISKTKGALNVETKNPIYLSCVIPDNGMQLINDAISKTNNFITN